MKIVQVVLLILAALVFFIAKGTSAEVIYFKIGAIVVFMFSMMRLSAKTPSKNQNKGEEDV